MTLFINFISSLPLFSWPLPLSKGVKNSFYLELNTNKTSGGCPQPADSKVGLPIVLSWTCTQVAAWVQFILLGATDSTLSDWLCFC